MIAYKVDKGYVAVERTPVVVVEDLSCTEYMKKGFEEVFHYSRISWNIEKENLVRFYLGRALENSAFSAVFEAVILDED